MLKADDRCSSCGIILKGRDTTIFLCPSCGQTTIGRCRRCRDQGVAYSCKSCGFRGP